MSKVFQIRNRFQSCLPLLAYFVLIYILFFGYDIAAIYWKVYATGDAFTYYLPAKIFCRESRLWNDLVCAGSPVFAEPQYQNFYPLNWLVVHLLPPIFGFNFFCYRTLPLQDSLRIFFSVL